MPDFVFLLVLVVFLVGCDDAAPSTQVLYIPLDNRPLNYSNVLPLGAMAAVDIITPPAAMLGQGSQPGQGQQLQKWLGQQAHQGDVWVLSLDMLLYGGLAPSRSHDLSSADVEASMQHLRRALQVARERQVPVYMLATSMRSAASSKSAQQPGYFARHGDDILRLSQLTDLADLNLAAPDQLAAMAEIKQNIPAHILTDYLKRREINLLALQKAVALAADDLVSYLVVGKDDTTPHSFTGMEMRQVSKWAEQSAVSHKLDIFPGADELGALLLARGVNELGRQSPGVYVSWGSPSGTDTVALYEDITLEQNTLLHIKCGGARAVSTPQAADLILVLNTPTDKVTEAALQQRAGGKESNGSDALGGHATPPPHQAQLARQIAAWQQNHVPVAVADVAYANGGDLALMDALAQAKVLPDLAAYAGCNTAGNSIGMALAQGLLYVTMEQKSQDTRTKHSSKDPAPQAQKQSLYTRLGEDWAYQSVIRPALTARQSSPLGAGTPMEDDKTRQLEKEITQELNVFFQRYINPILDEDITISQVTLPWQRLFDVELKLQWD